MIYTHQQYQDLEQQDRIETTLVGLRYVGRSGTELPSRPRDRGGWPGEAVFQGGAVTGRDEDGAVTGRERGPLQFGIVPDTIRDDGVDGGSLAGLESLTDFEVVYAPDTLAEAMLRRNDLPANAFGGPRISPDYDVRQTVYEALGLDDLGRTAPEAEDQLREALAEIAGVEDTDEGAVERSRTERLAEEYSRGALMSAVSEHDEATVAGRIQSAKKSELAAALVEVTPSNEHVRQLIGGETEE